MLVKKLKYGAVNWDKAGQIERFVNMGISTLNHSQGDKTKGTLQELMFSEIVIYEMTERLGTQGSV